MFTINLIRVSHIHPHPICSKNKINIYIFFLFCFMIMMGKVLFPQVCTIYVYF